jgi:hypothetical protein
MSGTGVPNFMAWRGLNGKRTGDCGAFMGFLLVRASVGPVPVATERSVA